MKVSSIAVAMLLAIGSVTTATAGVAPNSAATAAARSGARIAPTKPAEQKTEDHTESQSDSAK